MHLEAMSSNDRFDQIRAPRFASYIDASFEHPEYFMPNFSRDIVPTQEIFAWEFTVPTNIENELRIISWDSQELTGNSSVIAGNHRSKRLR